MHKDLTNPDYLSWLAFISGASMWNTRALQENVLSNLKRAVYYAYTMTEGYRNLYDQHGVHPAMLNKVEDIRLFPFVTKEMIRDNLDAFTVRVPGMWHVATSGSTGIPLGIYRGPLGFARDLASKAWFYRLRGWSESDRCIRLRGDTINSPDHIELKEEFNELRLSSYHLAPDVMEYYYKKAVEYDPKWLKCYPSTGFMFARWLIENGKELNLEGVLCASEKLYSHQEEFMEEAFNCKIYSHYGHYENAVLAGYCERSSLYHVLPYYGYAEVLDGNNESVSIGGRGEIVATSFINQATLFIRYRTQDFARYQGDYCPECGRSFQVWEDIDGRLQEFVITKDSRYIPLTGLRFPDRHHTFEHIAEFQFRQSEPGIVTLCIVPKSSFNDQIRTAMVETINEGMEDMEITIQVVDRIERTDRAKQRLLIREEGL